MTGHPRRKKLFRLPWRSARQIRSDVDEELTFHLDMRIGELINTGLNADAARHQALHEFGDIDDARQYLDALDRDIEAAQRRSDLMTDLWQDITYAVRKLRSAPGFTFAAIITLALGIGANTAIFSVVNSVLLKPLPFAQPDHLVRFKFTQKGQGDAGTPMDLIDYRTQAKTLEGVAIVEGATANLARDNGDAERLLGVRVSGNWFDLLRVKPLRGRLLARDDEKPGAPNVVVLSEELWRRDFSASPEIIGRPIRINATPFTVVGVLPAGLRYPITAELFMPKQLDPTLFTDRTRGARWLGYMARVKDGVSVEAADAEVTRISEAMEMRFPEDFRERRIHLTTVQNFLVGDMRKPLYIILGAVLLVLLIACANVANLLLVRASARESEIAIRTALGAGRTRLVRQLMTESVILALVGAAVGVVIAKIGLTQLLGRAPQDLVLIGKTSLDGTTLAVTAVVAILTGLIFGTLPALHSVNPELATTLRAGGRGARGQPGANRTKRVIVVAELGLAVMLLSGAGLLLHSFAKLLAVDPGFRPEGVLSMKVVLPPASYDSSRILNFLQALDSRLRAIPGVQSVGIADAIPFDGSGNNYSFTIRGRTFARSSDEPSAEVRVVTPDFFKALGVPVLRGRAIEPTDIASAPPVFVVNETFAKRFFPNQNVIGQAIRLGWGRSSKGVTNDIVGVVQDVRGGDLGAPPDPTVYAAFAQFPQQSMGLMVRAAAAPASLTAPVRSAIRDLDRDLPVYSVQTMEDRVASSVGRQRFYATLIAIFAAVALVLAAVGLYGVIAYAVSQRTHELGVRVALGATSDRISGMVIREGFVLTALGVGIGIVGSLAAGQVVSTLLYGVSARDPLTLVGVVVVLALVSTLASWLPARRAARVDPLVAMRGD